MKYKQLMLTLFIGFLLAPQIVLGQSNWERYEPRTLKQIADNNYLPFMADERFNEGFSGKEFASIVEVTYMGKSRTIAPQKKQLILALGKVKKAPDYYLSQFQREYLFIENAIEYWIPVQEGLVQGLEEDVEKGERIKLYVVWAGYKKIAGQLEPVFLTNRFATRADEREFLTRREIVAKAYEASVLVVGLDKRRKEYSQGSGFFIAPNVIATNYHVIQGLSSIFVKQESDKLHRVTLLRVDKNSDLALLKTTTLEGQPLKLFEGTDLYVGDDIYVMGSPKGLSSTFSSGNISAFRKVDNITYMQISAPISPGSSGGPVLNQYGEVIGIVQSQLKDGQNLNFAVPSIYLSVLLSGEQGVTIEFNNRN